MDAVRLGRGTSIVKMNMCWVQCGWKDVISVEVLKELSTQCGSERDA